MRRLLASPEERVRETAARGWCDGRAPSSRCVRGMGVIRATRIRGFEWRLLDWSRTISQHAAWLDGDSRARKGRSASLQLGSIARDRVSGAQSGWKRRRAERPVAELVVVDEAARRRLFWDEILALRGTPLNAELPTLGRRVRTANVVAQRPLHFEAHRAAVSRRNQVPDPRRCWNTSSACARCS